MLFSTALCDQARWLHYAKGEDPGKDGLIKGGAQVQSLAHTVHNDYTITSAPLRVKQLTEPPRINDTYKTLMQGQPLVDESELETLSSKRYAFINVWRNISDVPVEDDAIGLCDGASLAATDLITVELRYVDRTQAIRRASAGCTSPRSRRTMLFS